MSQEISPDAYEYIGDPRTNTPSVNARLIRFAGRVANDHKDTLDSIISLEEQFRQLDEKLALQLAASEEARIKREQKAEDRKKVRDAELAQHQADFKLRFEIIEAKLSGIASSIENTQSRPPKPTDTTYPLNPFLQDGGYGPEKLPAERHDDGTINFGFGNEYKADREYTLNDVRLKEIFPAMVLVDEYYCPEGSARSKVTFPKELRLTIADATVLDKLEKIQTYLRVSMIPYAQWPSRVILELTGDFASVARWATANHPTWPLLVEAIVQILAQHHVLHMQVTQFSTLLPFKDEAYANFAWRLRDAFFKLSRTQQTTPIVRSILVDKIRTNMPSVFAEITDKINTLAATDLMEEIVWRARVHNTKAIEKSIYGNPQTTVQLQGTSAPFYDLQIGPATADKPGVAQIKPPNAQVTQTVISDPPLDDRTVHPTEELTPFPPSKTDFAGAAQERDNKCFNCGKQGHWAQNCRVKPKQPPFSRPDGRRVTLKGVLYNDDKRSALTDRVRNTVTNWRNKGRGNPRSRGPQNTRVHLVDADDPDEDRRDPISRVEDDDDVDELLEGIFSDLDIED
jgi:hypothetical protein